MNGWYIRLVSGSYFSNTLTFIQFLLFSMSSVSGIKWLSLTSVSLGVQTAKSLPAKQEIQVWSLGWEDPLEKEMATHFSTLAWKIPMTEEPGRLQSTESQRVGHDWATSLTVFFWDWKLTTLDIIKDFCIVNSQILGGWIFKRLRVSHPWMFSFQGRKGKINFVIYFYHSNIFFKKGWW